MRATGPRIVVCTSLDFGEPDELGILAHSAEASWLCRTPRLPITLNGTGDAFTALFLGYWLTTGRLDGHAGARGRGHVRAGPGHACAPGSRELELVAAQDELLAPKRVFVAERVR